MKNRRLLVIAVVLLLFCCKDPDPTKSDTPKTNYSAIFNGVLDFKGNPKNKADRSMLMFSDQGAWFGYSLPYSETSFAGFSGPFLMTQENGVWAGSSLSQLRLVNSSDDKEILDWEKDLIDQQSYASHLGQTYENDELKVEQQLVFMSGHTALQQTVITNMSNRPITLNSGFSGKLFNLGIKVIFENNYLKLRSSKSNAIGYIQFLDETADILIKDSLTYDVNMQALVLQPKASKELLVSQTFIFPEYSWEEEQKRISNIDFDSVLEARKSEKERELTDLIERGNSSFKGDRYNAVLAKAHLTLQNNWRIAAGTINYQGVFPSYHYKGFHGFWSWDSWKHAVGLSYYNPLLAKDQIRAMYDYQSEDGFIVDCIYRDTTIEANNYRDTKPPLSAWAVAKITEKNEDIDFIKEMYPKLKKYHSWWYTKRDHDKDGICEFGSTDGTVLAAKWESGMDNAIRFDHSKILKNSEGAYSLDQESVDLNAYLYAEKLYLAFLAEKIQMPSEAKNLKAEAALLKKHIQNQFFDEEDGWFYDTNLAGTAFIKGAGSEGWTTLWANAATEKQAEAVKNKMMDPKKFFTQVPFQTMAADHPKFNPLEGYWRGPNWLDQAYFGIAGLRNYGYHKEANLAIEQILLGAEGILDKGSPIYENYHPLTGEGLNAKNFSWSAAHLIMLLTDEK